VEFLAAANLCSASCVLTLGLGVAGWKAIEALGYFCYGRWDHIVMGTRGDQVMKKPLSWYWAIFCWNLLQ
jgi:hypothetical protein